MVYSVGTAILQVVPSFSGLQTKSKEAAREIETSLREAVKKGLSDGLGAGPALGPAKKTGTQVGSTLASSIRSQLQAALRSLPKIEIDANTSPAKRDIEEIRREIASLVPRIGVNVDTEQAAARIAQLQAQLKAISDASPDIDVRADTASASAALARITAEIERIRSGSPTVTVTIEANEGRFAARLAAAIEAAQQAIPDINIDINSTAAEAELVSLRARLEALSRLEIDVDISAADAVAEVAAIRAAFDALTASGADIRIDVDAAAASAELAAFEALVAAVDQNDVDVDVKAGPGIGGATAGIALLVVAIGSILPALAPLAAVAGGTLGAIGAAALTALPGIATLVFALYGVFDAVKQLGKADEDAGKASQTIAAAHQASASAARQVEQAEDSLANTRANAAVAAEQAAQQIVAAQKSVADAQADAADAEVTAARRVSDATTQLARTQRDTAQAASDAARRVADAQNDAAQAATAAAAQIQSALTRQASAERDLIDAQVDARDAQDALTEARKAADQQMQDLTLSVEDGALRQRQATLDVQDAQQDLADTIADPTASDRDRQQAQLRYDQAIQNLKEIQLRNARLADEQAKSQAAGVTGQDVYRDAVKRATDAVQTQTDAQQAVTDAAAAVAAARVSSAQSVADAEQRVVDAQTAQTRQGVTGAEQVAAAEQTVTDARAAAVDSAEQSAARIAAAQASVTSAVASSTQQQRQSAFSVAQAEEAVTTARLAAAQASAAEGRAASDAGKAARDALASLSPAGAAFAVFLYGLRGPLGDLRTAAQESFLPGLQKGLEALLPLMPVFENLTRIFGAALGDLATRIGEAFSSPTMLRFFDYLSAQAGPIIEKLGTIAGNLFGGLIDLFVAFEPYTNTFLDAFVALSGRFLTFAADLTNNPAFQSFLAYLVTAAPEVSAFLGSLINFLTTLGVAFAPLGDIILQGFTILNNFLVALGPDGLLLVLGSVAALLGALALAFDAPIVAIVLIGGAFIAFAGLLAKLYNDNQTFHDLIQTVWSGIQAVISFAWEQVIRPAFQATRDFIVNTLAPAMVNLWHNVIEPAFAGIGAVVKFVWENVISPALGALVFYWQNILSPALNFLWHNIFAPAFSAIGTIISIWWAAASIIFDALVFVFQKTIGPALEFLWKNVFEPAFSGIGSVVKTIWENVISPALEALRKFFADTLGPAITTGVSAFTTAFGLIRAAAAKPINFIINTVYTNGIKALFDKVADTVGSSTRMPTIQPIPETFEGYATGGRIGGYSPTKTADNVPIMATAGEFMQPVDAVDYYGPGAMEAIRRRAIPREALQGLARGGSVDSLVDLGKKLQGMGIRVSENRYFGGVSPVPTHAAGGWHYKLGGAGALDLNLGTGNPKGEKEALDSAVAFANAQDFRTIWQAQGHTDHAHVDLASTASIGSKGSGGFLDSIADGVKALGSSAGDVLGNLWSGATDALSPFTDLVKKMTDGVGTSPFAQLAGGVTTKGIDLVKDWVSSHIGSLFGGSQDNVDGGGPSADFSGGGVERWRATALQALAITGSPSSWIGSLLRRMQQESHGDPNAIQGDLGDINNRTGNLARGLMQVIPPTFKSNALPGYDKNIYDPLSNIIASIRYADGRYGDAPRGWDRKGGYATGGPIISPRDALLFDSGGYLPPGVSTIVNNLGRPEPLANVEDLMTPASRAAADTQLIGSLFRDVYPVEKADFDLLFREAGFAMTASGLGG